MSVRKKIFVLLLVTLGLLLLVQYTVYHSLIFPSYVELERKEALGNLKRVIETLRREIVYLDTLTHDWAAWDDMAEYMTLKNGKFIEKNLKTNVFVDNRLNFCQLVDTGGRVIWQSAVNLSNRKAIEIRGLPRDRYPEDHLLVSHSRSTGPLDERYVRGIIILEGQPAIIAARPVLTSDNEGPIMGTVILGRFFDKQYIRLLAGITGMKFSLTLRPPSRKPFVQSKRPAKAPG